MCAGVFNRRRLNKRKSNKNATLCKSKETPMRTTNTNSRSSEQFMFCFVHDTGLELRAQDLDVRQRNLEDKINECGLYNNLNILKLFS